MINQCQHYRMLLQGSEDEDWYVEVIKILEKKKIQGNIGGRSSCE